MTLRSKYPDVEIPNNISWPGYLFKEFVNFGSKEAIVSEYFRIIVQTHYKELELIY